MYIKRRESWRPGLELGRAEVERLRKARRVARKDRDVELDRRLRAVLLAGHDCLTQESVAFIVERTENCVTRWIMAYKEGGIEALVPRKAPGAAPKLGEAEQGRLYTVILNGPEDAGLDTGVWTGPIVQALIAREFGVHLSVSQVRRILHKIGMSVKYPHAVSAVADPKAQFRWLSTDYPAIKKGRQRKAA